MALPHRTAAIASRSFKPVEVRVAVLIGEEAGLAIDAALDDMQRLIGEQEAGYAQHVRHSTCQMTLAIWGLNDTDLLGSRDCGKHFAIVWTLPAVC